MARIRTIKPEFPQSESMGRVSRDARLAFVLMWTLADDAGRLRGNSRMLASLLFPYDDDAPALIEGWIAELEHEGCVVRYKVDGQTYVEIRNWLIHQKIDKPSQSKLPTFDESSRVLANPRESSSLDLRTKEGIKEGRGEEGKGGAEPSGPAPDAAPPPPESLPVITIPLVDKSEHPVMRSDVVEWSEAYPAVDVMQELRAMRQWCIAHPTRRKTARGVRAFVVAWLGREQDRGGQRRPVGNRDAFAEFLGEPIDDGRTINA